MISQRDRDDQDSEPELEIQDRNALYQAVSLRALRRSAAIAIMKSRVRVTMSLASSP
jgi:hypothetical protein